MKTMTMNIYTMRFAMRMEINVENINVFHFCVCRKNAVWED